MLRITTITHAASTLKLEGTLTEPWLDELRHACAENSGLHRPINFDLSDVTFVDAAGGRLLQELTQTGIARISSSSNYIAELLHLEVSR
jgi:ABC-type transporter Mla MlaB component